MNAEKRLFTDLKSVRNSYKNFEIDDIAHIKSEHYIFDALTRSKNEPILI